MKLRDPELMAKYMEHQDFSGARLARYAGCSRQFIWQLLNDSTKRSCTPEVARLIEEALSLLPGTLFVDPESHVTRPAVPRRPTRRPVNAA